MSPVTILVVDDERELADLYTEWLNGAYAVRTAYTAEGGFEQLDEAVDVVLLDRRMPDTSGDAVLEEIRDRGLDCRVAMVTAVEPDVNVIEMGFDDYLTKPISRSDLQDAVERLLARADYSERVQDYFAVQSKLALLEAEKSQEILEQSDEYLDLAGRRDQQAETLDTAVGDMDSGEFEALLRDMPANHSRTDPSATW